MFIKKLVFLIISLTMAILPQTDDITCGTQGTSDPLDITQRGGRYLTSSGELKVLVVFAKFQGDNSGHPYWPANSFPTEMGNFIDPNQQTNSTHFLNLTNYFKQMSYYNFKVIGTAVGVTTPYPISHYIIEGSTYPNRVMANKDALLAADVQVNFNQFDNWTYIRDYKFNNVPDGIIDMVIIIWRGLVFSVQWSGEASLGGIESDYLWVENNQKKIKMDYGGNELLGIRGSGVTVQYWGEKSRERNFHVAVHEVAHWLIQGEHPYNAGNYQFWGMLTLADQGICANSFEREKLAWLNPTPIQGNIVAAPLSDFVTTAVSYKYHPPNAFFYTEMYYFENHQRQSVYDNISSNNDDKGIYILHLQQSWYAGDCMRVLSSDGFWNWESPYSTNCWNNNLPAFKKKGVNRSGYGHRDRITSTNSISDFLFAYINDNNQVECNDWLHGYGFKSAFTKNYNDVFSPWSNPPATTWDGQLTDFIMEVINNESIITVSFATQTAIGGKPSKPQNLKLSILYNHPVLTWDANQETDLVGYNIYRAENGGVPELIGYVPQAHRKTFTDYSANTSIPSDNYDYTIKAKDNTELLSVPSDKVSIMALAPKLYLGNGELVPSKYILEQNYPNPFNPSAIINYTLKEDGLVKIKVYDILGSEVAELVNEMKEAGYHSAEFNASNLPSGVYIYTMQVNGFSSSNKMLLLK